MNQLIIEMCPSCESEAGLLWDTDQDGYQAYCPYCGERLMLCSACPATFDEENCTYDRDTDTCHRQRAENEREETKMTDKLILTDVREGNQRYSTRVNVYDDTHELLKDLNARTGQSITLLANRLIKFAYNHVVIDSEEAAE